jgi:hypothetical protein
MKGMEALQAIWDTAKNMVPIVLFLFLFQLLVLRKPLDNVKTLFQGIVLSILGLHFFLKGLSISLLPLGDSIGGNLVVMDNRVLIVTFAFVLGYVATLAEPALKVLALEVEEISVGAIPSKILIQAVAIGFGIGMTIGIVKIIANIPLKTIAFPIVLLAVILGYFAPREFVDIALDCASATTGPINVPLNMSIALGLSKVVGASDPLLNGFGIVGLTSLGAVVSVLALGILVK